MNLNLFREKQEENSSRGFDLTDGFLAPGDQQ